MQAYQPDSPHSESFSTCSVSARELQNGQRAPVKLGSGGEGRTGRRWGCSEAWAHLYFRAMLSTVHSRTSLLSIGRL